MLERRYGAGVTEHRNRMFDEAGLPHAPAITKLPNSKRALILGELARDRGVYDAVHRRLYEAYWVEDRDIGDAQVLVAEGTAAGLEEGDIRAAWADPDYAARISAATTAVLESGAGGVPAWVIDERVLVPGAQPHDVFERVLERLGYTPADD